jgi:hypothetical protein
MFLRSCANAGKSCKDEVQRPEVQRPEVQREVQWKVQAFEREVKSFGDNPCGPSEKLCLRGSIFSVTG